MRGNDPDRRCSHFRVHGRLQRFLSPRRRGDGVDFCFDGRPALKDPVEALGIPHTEVDTVRIDGCAVDLRARLDGGEVVEVYPALRQSIAGPARFVLDVHLGRLAGYLRLLGFDTRYGNDVGDDELVARSVGEQRILLSRDAALLKRSAVERGAFVYATDPAGQVVEIVERFDLRPRIRAFERCSRCNGAIAPLDPGAAAPLVPARVRARVDRFSQCSACRHVYWQGSHGPRLWQRLEHAGLRLEPPASSYPSA